MERLKYTLKSDHKWSKLRLLAQPELAVVVPFNDGYVVIPTVTTDAATSVKPSTAALNGTLDNGGGAACDCGFEYGLTTSYGTTTSTQSKNTGETFSQAITGLLPNRIYHFRAFATNQAGTGYGSDATFKTTALGNPNVDQLIYQHAERIGRLR